MRQQTSSDRMGPTPILVRSRQWQQNVHDRAYAVVRIRDHHSCGRSRPGSAGADPGVAIHKILTDLRSPTLRLPSVDGILMANSLHFIEDQHLLLRNLSSVAERFLIVEYERSKRNRWGPYPVGFEKLREHFGSGANTRVSWMIAI
jgi:hypothetical protein